MKLKFNSERPVNLNRQSPTVCKIIEACKAMKDGDLFDKYFVASVINASTATISDSAPDPAMQEYCLIVSGRRWFGNASTIAEAKKQRK